MMLAALPKLGVGIAAIRDELIAQLVPWLIFALGLACILWLYRDTVKWIYEATDMRTRIGEVNYRIRVGRVKESKRSRELSRAQAGRLREAAYLSGHSAVDDYVKAEYGSWAKYRKEHSGETKRERGL